jgi:predicted  nucleic acid-binding Zn-ribbon protein
VGAQECIICGAAFGESDSEHCPECGGAYFVGGETRSAERRPVEYGPGDHAALLYDSDDRCLDVLVPFVRDGVAAGNRVIGVVDDRTRDLLREQLTTAEARRVEMIAPAAQYGEVFSADRTYEGWSRLISATDGILRGFGGLDEPTARSVDPAEWRRYEASIADLLQDEALGLCLYDTRYCPRELLETGAGHPLIGARDKVHVCA